MKLKDFNNSELFKNIRKKMDIPKDYNVEMKTNMNFEKSGISKAVWQEIEMGRGLDIKQNEIEISDDYTLEYKGKKMILYIRDVQLRYSNSTPKFHLSWCSTLEKMKNYGRLDRYVVSRRLDGNFFVNIIDNKILVREELLELNVCKNCLGKLNYMNYNNIDYVNKNKIYEKFLINEFLSKYETKFKKIPKYTDVTAPINQYPKNWSILSTKYREHMKWKCEKCGNDFSENKSRLDTHHINGDKSNCNYYNLKALCKMCHGEEPYHSHYKNVVEKL